MEICETSSGEQFIRCNAAGLGPSFYYGDCVDRNSECAISRHVDQTGGSAGSDSHRRRDRLHYFGIVIGIGKTETAGSRRFHNQKRRRNETWTRVKSRRLAGTRSGSFSPVRNGAEVSKISIRGSGITSEDEPIGVMFLLDPLRRCLLARRIPSWISPLQRAFDFSRLYKPD
jgi:hypothetical protein